MQAEQHIGNPELNAVVQNLPEDIKSKITGSKLYYHFGGREGGQYKGRAWCVFVPTPEGRDAAARYSHSPFVSSNKKPFSKSRAQGESSGRKSGTGHRVKKGEGSVGC
eukprot:5332225-Pyramimonas_sp.AAC.1